MCLIYSLDCGSPTIDHSDFSGDTFYTGTPVVTCHPGYNKAGTAVCQTDGTWQLPTCTAKGNCQTQALIGDV